MNLSELSYSTRTVRQLDFAARAVELPHLADLMRAGTVAYSQMREHIVDGLIHELRACVWAEKVVEVVEESDSVTVSASCSVDVPSDWWQAFRGRWFPKWWLKRHPVKTTKHTAADSKTVKLRVTVDCSAVYLDWKPIGEAPCARRMDSKKQVIEWNGFSQ